MVWPRYTVLTADALEVQPSATDNEIKKAYRKVCLLLIKLNSSSH
jgi:hypothetical protein